MIRTQLLDRSNSKTFKLIVLFLANFGIIYGLNYLSEEYFKTMEKDFKLEDNKYKALIEEQSEVTNKIVNAKEDLIQFLNDGKEVLKD